ncbi:MAG: hypothetical protein AABX04_04455 [Nanoarchaeota archaeon]|mgnify:CR=1 FL=1
MKKITLLLLILTLLSAYFVTATDYRPGVLTVFFDPQLNFSEASQIITSFQIETNNCSFASEGLFDCTKKGLYSWHKDQFELRSDAWGLVNVAEGKEEYYLELMKKNSKIIEVERNKMSVPTSPLLRPPTNETTTETDVTITEKINASTITETDKTTTSKISDYKSGTLRVFFKDGITLPEAIKILSWYNLSIIKSLNCPTSSVSYDTNSKVTTVQEVKCTEESKYKWGYVSSKEGKKNFARVNVPVGEEEYYKGTLGSNENISLVELIPTEINTKALIHPTAENNTSEGVIKTPESNLWQKFIFWITSIF